MDFYAFEQDKASYVSGVRLMSIRSTHPKIVGDGTRVKLSRSYGNYDLIFDKHGILIEKITYTDRENYFDKYNYGDGGILTEIQRRLDGYNSLSSLSQFGYNWQGRISNEKNTSFSLLGELVDETIYQYSINSVLIINIGNEEFGGYQEYKFFNSFGQVVERKLFCANNELWDWDKFEYDDVKKILIKEFSLDEEGEIQSVIQYFPYERDLMTGYSYSSQNTNFLREYKYVYNDFGHWITRASLTDGEAREYVERNIEYW